MMIDIHCHPSLKTYLFENSIFSPSLKSEHLTISETNYLTLQADLPKMRRGGVRAAITAHYIPELELINESTLLTTAADLLNIFWRKIVNRIEKIGIEKISGGQGAFAQTLESIRIFEEKINSLQLENENTAIAHSYEELENYLKENKTVFLHAVEGAHSLGRNLPSKSSSSNQADDYIRNLDVLYDKGICMLTLGHFYDNDIVSPPEGIPPSARIILDKHAAKDLTKKLTPVGEGVIRRMIDRGMIVDLVHTTKPQRKRIFEINDEFKDNKRPVVFSHSGVMELFQNPGHPLDKYINPDEEDILKIKACNGVIGIIFMNYYLSGHDDRLFVYEPAVEFVYNTIEKIRSLTNSYDNIAIGTDFDGMNDPADDLYNYSHIPKLRKYLRKKGISEKNINKIMHENALRVLREGWGKEHL